MKVVCLGSDFVEGDSLAFEVGKLLKEERFDDYEIINVKNSFELMEIVSSEKDFVVLDVVDGLDEVCELGIGDLRIDSILSAHDFDAGFVLGLMGEGVRIVGIPRKGDAGEILKRVLEIIAN